VSQNDYDWLGPGIYFWESNPKRAYSFAAEQVSRKRIESPFVVGAVLSLGNCVDTLNEDSLNAISEAHQLLLNNLELAGTPAPKNTGGTDLIIRRLDCAVIKTLHQIVQDAGEKIDSVRGLYHEGGSLFDNSGFYKKSHVQICVCNVECIKGVFRISLDSL
jgi:hypothetical protein